MNIWRRLVKLVIESFLLLAGTAIFIVAFQFAVNSFRPASHWLRYDSVELAPRHQGLYVIGDTLSFRSSSIQSATVSLSYEDKLHCRFNDGTEKFYTGFIDSVIKRPRIMGLFDRSQAKKGWETFSGIWDWGGQTPEKPGECKLLGRPVFVPSPFVEPKRVEIDSDWFKVVLPFSSYPEATE